jgi:hypothetical protein
MLIFLEQLLQQVQQQQQRQQVQRRQQQVQQTLLALTHVLIQQKLLVYVEDSLVPY